MRDIEKEILPEIFEHDIVSKIQNESDKNFVKEIYKLNPETNKYQMIDDLIEDYTFRLNNILNSISYISQFKKKGMIKQYQKIEKYFISKKEYIEDSKHIPIEEIIRDAPKYYGILRFIEKLNIFLSNDKNWLKNFVIKNKIDFDWANYQKWKTGKDFNKLKYDATACPSLWVHSIQDKFIEIVKSLQILIYFEFFIDEDDFKTFLKVNPAIDYRVKANYLIPSYPADKIEILFNVIDQILSLNMENDFKSQAIVDTVVCLQAYRFVDESELFELLKKKEFYIKYHLEYLLKTPANKRLILPHEEDIIGVANEFITMLRDLFSTYSEYKSRLMTKYQIAKNRMDK